MRYDIIKFTQDKPQIVSLWQSVFGDDEEDIVYFLNNCKNKRCLGFFENDKLISMLFLVDCEYCGCQGKYIYAVATDESFRNKGCAGALINEAKKYAEDFLWLIPANMDLFDYYSKFDFKIKLFTNSEFENKITFDEYEEIVDYLYEGSEFDFPKGMFYSLKKFPDGDTGIINKGE